MSDTKAQKPNELNDLTRLRWRFVICSASFYINVIAWGFISSTGIYEDAFKTTYELLSFKSSLPGSIQIAAMSVFSVFASVLTIQCGVRSTTISGALIATFGSIFAAIIAHYWAFCVFYGLFIGIGEAFMLVPAILAIPPYFHASRVSLATASAVSGASIGMFGIPFLLKYLLDTYGLYGATLLTSCLWLSVALAGALFGKGVSTIEEVLEEPIVQALSPGNIENPRESTATPRHRSMGSTPGLIFSRRTSLLPSPTHYYHQQQHQKGSSSIDQTRPSHQVMIILPENDEQTSSSQSGSTLNSSPFPIKVNDHRSLDSATDQRKGDAAVLEERIPPDRTNPIIEKKKKKNICWQMLMETCLLFRIPTFCLLLVSMVLIWSLDETNFLFLSDLLKTTGQSEQRSTLLIAITGIADLIGQLFFGYLGDVECLDPFLLWTYSSVIAGLALSISPWMATYGMAPLSIVFAIHAFFLAAPNALGNVIMIDVVGIHHYAMAYGFSLLVSGSTSLFGYPLLGFLKDKTHSWTIPFALVGVVMIFGGLVIGTVPLYRYYQRKRRKT